MKSAPACLSALEPIGLDLASYGDIQPGEDGLVRVPAAQRSRSQATQAGITSEIPRIRSRDGATGNMAGEPR